MCTTPGGARIPLTSSRHRRPGGNLPCNARSESSRCEFEDGARRTTDAVRCRGCALAHRDAGAATGDDRGRRAAHGPGAPRRGRTAADRSLSGGRAPFDSSRWRRRTPPHVRAARLRAEPGRSLQPLVLPRLRPRRQFVSAALAAQERCPRCLRLDDANTGVRHRRRSGSSATTPTRGEGTTRHHRTRPMAERRLLRCPPVARTRVAPRRSLPRTAPWRCVRGMLRSRRRGPLERLHAPTLRPPSRDPRSDPAPERLTGGRLPRRLRVRGRHPLRNVLPRPAEARSSRRRDARAIRTVPRALRQRDGSRRLRSRRRNGVGRGQSGPTRDHAGPGAARRTQCARPGADHRRRTDRRRARALVR